MRRVVWIALIGACGGRPDLAGAWTGTVECSGFTMDMTLDLEGNGDPGETSGPGEIPFTDGGGTDYVLEFNAGLEAEKPKKKVAEVAMVLGTCTEASQGDFPCWLAYGVTWDAADDEIAGMFDEGFPVNDGECPFQLER